MARQKATTKKKAQREREAAALLRMRVCELLASGVPAEEILEALRDLSAGRKAAA